MYQEMRIRELYFSQIGGVSSLERENRIAADIRRHVIRELLGLYVNKLYITYECMCIDTYMYICLYMHDAYVFRRMRACIYVCIFIRAHVFVHVYKRVR